MGHIEFRKFGLNVAVLCSTIKRVTQLCRPIQHCPPIIVTNDIAILRIIKQIGFIIIRGMAVQVEQLGNGELDDTITLL